MGMKIKRVINGEAMEFELTSDEIFAAYKYQEHEWDLDYVRNSLEESREDEFSSLDDEQYEAALDMIAYEKRRIEDKYEYDEDDALSRAEKWYIDTQMVQA